MLGKHQHLYQSSGKKKKKKKTFCRDLKEQNAHDMFNFGPRGAVAA